MVLSTRHRRLVMLCGSGLLMLWGPTQVLAQGSLEITSPEDDKVLCKDEVATGSAKIACSGDFHQNPGAKKTWSGDADEQGTLDTSVVGARTASVDVDGCSSDSVSFKVIELKILMPTDRANRIAYEQQQDGALVAPFEGTTGVQELDDKLEWRLDPIPGTTMTPADPKGGKVEVTYQPLPEDNSAFGKRTITMAYPEASCEDKKQTLMLYFEPEKYGNPMGSSDKLTNWYYYWWDTAANVIPDHLYADDDCSDVMGNGQALYGYYTWGAEEFVICKPSNLSSQGPHTCPSVLNGIDTYATIVLHEGEHMNNWWKYWGNNDPYDISADQDGDLLPDWAEPDLGLDPEKTDTDGDGWNDEHDLAYDAQCRWKAGAANKEDWSKWGKQW